MVTIQGVVLNRNLINPNDKIIVRHLPSGSLIVLDTLKEVIPSIHRLLSDEEPKIEQELAPETISFPVQEEVIDPFLDEIMQEITPNEEVSAPLWHDPATGKSFKNEAALKGHFTRMANAQQTN